MKKTRLFCLLLALLLCLLPLSVHATPTADVTAPDLSAQCTSALLMEAGTGRVLYEHNADEALPPASVTKIMTLLLVMEAIEAGQLSYTDTVTASANACSMGGSQIYLKEGEQMSVEDMLKSVVIASANDAAVALAEHIAGTEEAFVGMMNKRAGELGMKNTHFENTNGLDDTVLNHVTSARDIALMSQALLRHERITQYSSTWMDSIRDGAFGLTNTNRLVRFYRGATGLKTGSTAKARFCISASATRDGMTLIAVIMAAPTRDVRNAAAVSLLDFGFANYTVYRDTPELPAAIRLTGGTADAVAPRADTFEAVVPRRAVGRIQKQINLPESLAAPIGEGDSLGTVSYTLDGEPLGELDVYAASAVPKIRFGDVLLRLLSKMLTF